MSGRYYLGVDGGGTKTEFVCLDADRRLVARTVGGTTYHLQVGLDGATAVLRAGVGAICAAAGLAPDDFAFVFFGLPAFGEDAVVDRQLDAACGRVLGHGRYRCGNDMICGWAGSLDRANGINLVAGTGSIGYGERDGRAARVGGWGETFSDEGSAYSIAVQGLNAFTRMSDGRLAPGPLHAGLVDALGLATDLDLCARVMGERGMNREEIAGLARIVSAAAVAGDHAAVAILNTAADELAAMAEALRTALAFEPAERTPLSWSGGVLTGVPAVRDALMVRLHRANHFQVVEPRYLPAFGAAIQAIYLSRSVSGAMSDE